MACHGLRHETYCPPSIRSLGLVYAAAAAALPPLNLRQPYYGTTVHSAIDLGDDKANGDDGGAGLGGTESSAGHGGDEANVGDMTEAVDGDVDDLDDADREFCQQR